VLVGPPWPRPFLGNVSGRGGARDHHQWAEPFNHRRQQLRGSDPIFMSSGTVA